MGRNVITVNELNIQREMLRMAIRQIEVLKNDRFNKQTRGVRLYQRPLIPSKIRQKQYRARNDNYWDRASVKRNAVCSVKGKDGNMA